MDVPASLAAEAGLARQNVALSVIRQSAEQDQRLADVISQAASTAPVSETRGTNVDISA